MGLKQYMPKKIFSEKPVASKNILIDSMLIEAFEAEKKEVAQKAKLKTKNDSLKFNFTSGTDSLDNQQITYYETDGIMFPPESFEEYSGNQFLISFYEKLYQLESGNDENVRIAYFGDSMTDGDMIVQDLRTKFQDTFGGQGVGFVSITSESASSRSSISHKHSENWKAQNFVACKSPSSPFGVNGHVFFANDTINSAWVNYKASKLRHLTTLDNPTVFYGTSYNQKAYMYYRSGKDTIYKKLNSSNLLNTITLSKSSLTSLKVNFGKARSIPIYGFNFDDGKGVHIDNFSKRGNSGMPLSKLNVSLMQAFQEKLGYDLIVLHYGTNVLNYGTYDYGWYNKSMTRTVNRLKECFPGVAILVVSTADKSTKYETEMKTDSAVVPLTLAQKRYALKTQSGFVNLYTLMGGNGSMVKWAEEVPAMANKDYTHFNYKGAKKIAGMLYDQLNNGYETYKILRKNRKAPIKKEIVNSDSIK